jgi:hypothetical protein
MQRSSTNIWQRQPLESNTHPGILAKRNINIHDNEAPGNLRRARTASMTSGLLNIDLIDVDR